MYKFVILQAIKPQEGHGSKYCKYFPKNAKNMNNSYSTLVKVAALTYAAQPVAL